MARRVLLIGATGLVGTICLRLLLEEDEIESVDVLTRRPLAEGVRPADDAGKLREHVIDFSSLHAAGSAFETDAVVSTLGTTMRKAGSRERFRAVDRDIPLSVARRSHARGAEHFVLVSSIGASPNSMFFYNRVKGELEEAIGQIGFERLTILRPSVLVGKRSEFRPGEEVGKIVLSLSPSRYRPVSAHDVATVIVRSLRRKGRGVEIIESDEIKRRARF